MSQFPADTILIRNEPRGDAADRLRVIGPSPVGAPAAAEWAASGGDALIVTPADEFGENTVIPMVYIAQNYTVESYPPEPEPEPRPRPGALNGPSPEQVFAQQAGAKPPRTAPLDVKETVIKTPDNPPPAPVPDEPLGDVVVDPTPAGPAVRPVDLPDAADEPEPS